MAFKKLLTDKQYLAQNSKNTANKMFLLLGEEESSKDDFINTISKETFKSNKYQLNHFYSENNEDFNGFIDFSRTTMIFSNSKVSIFYNIEKELANKTKKVQFDELVENIPENTLIFLKASSNSVPKQLKTDLIIPIMFWKPFESELTKYIISKFKELNIAIDFHAAKTLLTLTGRNKAKINDAIEKVYNYNPDGRVDSALIKSLLSNEKDVNIFEFIDSLFLKKSNILSLFKTVSESGYHELVILEFIKREIIKLEKYYSSFNECQDVQKSISAAGINPKSRDTFLEKISLFNLEKIHKLVKTIYSVEFELKSGQSGKGLQNSLVNIIYNIVKI